MYRVRITTGVARISAGMDASTYTKRRRHLLTIIPSKTARCMTSFFSVCDSRVCDAEFFETFSISHDSTVPVGVRVNEFDL